MIRVDDIVLSDECEQLYDAFMSDVLAVGGDLGLVNEIDGLLRFALQSECSQRLWSALDQRLLLLLAGSAHEPRHVAVTRLKSYVEENRFDA